ncbi:MAG: imidazolonepropionase [Desulfobacterales bacterium CG07_land_8_20_14_0_80_52_14]|nr:MAG: imidazolonepropionase [Desulfobacterales bacterium CG23_combo_of_CG06-09_8_20_14_all_52_9]PIU50426.1 MAG: imidazolonepropionase [Desulfobacterales bacterium CG07_land_8_20_14_0_80_52_14]
MPETLSIWTNIQVATMTPGSPYGAIENSALAVSGSRIAWVGKAKELPDPFKNRADRVYDGKGAWVTPGLVDCHTHLVYAGNRAREFELRLQGVSYEEISRRGGGILSTVFATRGADEQELFRQSTPRLESMLAQGVTTVEIKSGYGLDVDTELKMLRVARLLGKTYPVTVVPTFLGAHALPPEFRGDTDAYIDFVCRNVLPEVAGQGLAVAADAFCDTIGFTREQTEKVFRTAREHGLMIRLHAEQFSNQGAAELAAKFKALSADHLEHLSEEGAMAIAKSKTVAVLLPGAFYFIREKRLPPVDLLRRHAVPMAVSTDCNPGTSPTTSLLLMLNMACTLFGLTPEEALAGATIHAAKALGLEKHVGTLEVGKDADFVLWDITSPVELAYAFGVNPCQRIIRHGEPLDHRDFAPLPDAH